ncbi:MAG: hypothetical protein JRH14_05815 [Deltaproteobacteria bacterium]|nr:hypothetical protein [Deltaproteobacteria bacterium]
MTITRRKALALERNAFLNQAQFRALERREGLSRIGLERGSIAVAVPAPMPFMHELHRYFRRVRVAECIVDARSGNPSGHRFDKLIHSFAVGDHDGVCDHRDTDHDR